MDSIGKISDMLIAVILLFFVPVIWGRGNMRETAEQARAECCQEFLTNICEKGYISIASYEAFAGRLSSSERCSVEICHAKNVSGKKIEGDNMDEGNDMGTYPGESFYTDEILEILYSEGEYRLSIGDEISLQIQLSDKNRSDYGIIGFIGNSTGYYSCTLTVTGGYS